ncbi:unnamed protein product [Phytomonas sp. Hart1]|nr:unnamed protein product [Phytomonas sp. Hart1]|eukprot:CCW66814.1 unnamed protein product [Phytomonas sp. isolate Hart1]
MTTTLPQTSSTVSENLLPTTSQHALSSTRSVLLFQYPDGEEFKVVFDVLSCYDVVGAIGYGTYGCVCSAFDINRVMEFNMTPMAEYLAAETAEERDALYNAATHVAIKKLSTLFEYNQPRMWLCASREIQLMMAFRHANVLSAVDFFIPLGNVEMLTYESMQRLRDTFDSVYVVMKEMDYSLREVLDSAFITASEASPEYMELLFHGSNKDTLATQSTLNSPKPIEPLVFSDAINAESMKKNQDIPMNIATPSPEDSGRNKQMGSITPRVFCDHILSGSFENSLIYREIRKASNSARLVLRKLFLSYPNQVDINDNAEHLDSGSNSKGICLTPPTSKEGEPQSLDENKMPLAAGGESQQIPRTPSEPNLCCPGTGLPLHPLSKDYRKFILYQIFLGVGYLHRCLVMHRDLKPENILLDYNYKTCITDFGQGRDVGVNKSECIHTMLSNSSQWYAAPDTLTLSIDADKTGFIDNESFYSIDVWSIGCIAAEMLIGRPLFYNQHISSIGHLTTIVEILGEPSSESVQAILGRRYEYDREAFLYTIEAIRALFKNHQSILKELLKSPFGDETEDEVQLIVSCLAWNPQERITIQKALESPYFIEDGYEPVIDRKDIAKQVPVVRPEEISDMQSGRAFLWNLFTRRHPEVNELWRVLEERHNAKLGREV